MQSIFSAARQLGDEFVRVLDELAAEDDTVSTTTKGQGRQGRKKKVAGPPKQLVDRVAAKIRIGVLGLRSQEQLHSLVQHFTVTNPSASHHSFHHAQQQQQLRKASAIVAALQAGCAPGSTQLQTSEIKPEDWDDGITSKLFLFHLFLQINYLHDADWVTTLSSLLPTKASTAALGQSSPVHPKRLVRFPYVVGEPLPFTLVKESIEPDAARRLHRWIALFHLEREQQQLSDNPSASPRWSVGCSFSGHRRGARHLLPNSRELTPPDRKKPFPSVDEDLDENYELCHNESLTATMMGDEVSHRHLILTPCQRHRLFRHTTPALLWATHERRYSLWDLLPAAGSSAPIVFVLQSDELDVFGCILSSIPPVRSHQEEEKKRRGGEASTSDQPPFLSFFTFTPTFQFLDVESAPKHPEVAGDEEEEEAQAKPTLLGDPNALNTGNTAAYFMSLGEGDPPSLGRFQSSSSPSSPTKTPTSSGKGHEMQRIPSKDDSAFDVPGETIRREVNEVALSVDRPDEGGMTICARFTVSSGVAGEEGTMMVVVLDLSAGLDRCRVAAKSATANVHSGFHFNVVGTNVSDTSNTASKPKKSPPERSPTSVDDLAILEDDRREVKIRSIEVYHMDELPAPSPRPAASKAKTATPLAVAPTPPPADPQPATAAVTTSKDVPHDDTWDWEETPTSSPVQPSSKQIPTTAATPQQKGGAPPPKRGAVVDPASAAVLDDYEEFVVV